MLRTYADQAHEDHRDCEHPGADRDRGNAFDDRFGEYPQEHETEHLDRGEIAVDAELVRPYEDAQGRPEDDVALEGAGEERLPGLGSGESVEPRGDCDDEEHLAKRQRELTEADLVDLKRVKGPYEGVEDELDDVVGKEPNVVVLRDGRQLGVEDVVEERQEGIAEARRQLVGPVAVRGASAENRAGQVAERGRRPGT